MTKSKILGLALTLLAVIMLIVGFTSETAVDEFNIFWMAMVMALISGVLLSMGKVKAAVTYARIIVGGVFVVSGLIKANDTMGFGFKLEEYFDENALGAFWAYFHDYSLGLAIFISGIEVLLGLAVLYGAKARLVSITLLGMTVFFGWLTLFTAQCNDAQMAAMAAGESFDKVCVTDCGCFGDALRGSVGRSLTPWESFYKDLGLFFLTLVILFQSKSITVNTKSEDMVILPGALIVMLGFGGWLFGWMFPTWFFIVSTVIYLGLKRVSSIQKHYEWVLAGSLAIITYAFAFYTYTHLPIKDYRPYATGKDINDQMKSAEELGLEPTVYANVYKMKNKVTGEMMTMNSQDYLAQKFWENKDWEIESTLPDPIVITRGYEPPIATFTVTDENGSDIGYDILHETEYTFMVVMYDIDKSAQGSIPTELSELTKQAESAGIMSFGVSSSPYEAVEEYKHKYQLAFPIYTADEIFLKTIVRSNPGIVLMKEGKVMGKWHGNDLPSFAEISATYLN